LTTWICKGFRQESKRFSKTRFIQREPETSFETGWNHEERFPFSPWYS
jgi:hypothetical protein